MKIRTISTIIAVAACIGFATVAMAQKGTGQAEGVARQTEKPELVTLSGIVKEIKFEPCKDTTGRSTIGTHIILQIKDGVTREIHVGPERDVQTLIQGIEAKQPLAVTGFRTEALPKDALVATTLVVGEKTVTIRDKDLRPVWAGKQGQGRGKGMGQGQGRGKGMGQGQGQGRGQGMGRGQGPGKGMGQGQGRGQGMGQGRGKAMGQGQGPGKGMGQGRGRGMGMGQGRGPGQGAGPGAGMGMGRGYGRGAGGGQGQGGPGRGRGPGQGGNCPMGQSCMQQLMTQVSESPKGELTPKVREGLLLMREEEKLAHDVYVTLHKKWGLRPLANIPKPKRGTWRR